jgi:hypothetical protein
MLRAAASEHAAIPASRVVDAGLERVPGDLLREVVLELVLVFEVVTSETRESGRSSIRTGT